MNDRILEDSECTRAFLPEEGVTEVVLLLPGGQAAALERVARRQGLTVGQLLRRLLRDYLAGDDRPPGTVVIDREPDNPPAGRRT